MSINNKNLLESEQTNLLELISLAGSNQNDDFLTNRKFDITID